MNHHTYKLSFILIFLILIPSGCNFLYRNGLPVPSQTVSGPIEIGTEWVEITPPKPLKAYDISQYIVLGYYDYSKNKEGTTNEDGGILNLNDGRKTRIEAILYDDQGESYILSANGSGNGILFSRKRELQIIDGKEEIIYPHFLTDRTYTKLRMRSELPLRCNKIEWIGVTRF